MNDIDNQNGKRMSIEEFLDNDERKDLLRFLTAGSVDDGKSTLIGRLLFDSKKIYEDQLDALERDSKRMGNAGDHIDYALLLDGLKAEREQGITIDVAYRYFSTNKRKFIIADTPGHEQYTRNMITGGSTASLAVILVDARNGVITQTRRHTFLVSLLGIKHVVLAVNKMDLVGFAKQTFDCIVAEYMDFVKPLGIPDIQCIPLSALDGDNVVEKSERTPWYDGPTLLGFLETVSVGNDQNMADFRFPVQYVLRPNLDFRGFCGKVASGVVRKGDEVMALPSGKKSRVKAIVTQDGDLDCAFPPQCVTLTLDDEIDVSRGEMLVHPDNQPVTARCFEAMLVWMDEEPMDRSKQFYLKQTTNTTRARIDGIRYRVDVNTMEQSNADALKLNEIGKVVITTNKELFFDPYMKNKSCGSFIIIDPVTNNTSAVGMITAKADTADLFTPISDDDRLRFVRVGRECAPEPRSRAAGAFVRRHPCRSAPLVERRSGPHPRRGRHRRAAKPAGADARAAPVRHRPVCRGIDAGRVPRCRRRGRGPQAGRRRRGRGVLHKAGSRGSEARRRMPGHSGRREGAARGHGHSARQDAAGSGRHNQRSIAPWDYSNSTNCPSTRSWEPTGPRSGPCATGATSTGDTDRSTCSPRPCAGC